MSAEFLTTIAGVILSLLFSYIPGLNTWFAALESLHKRLIMLGLLFISALGFMALSCWGFLADLSGIQIPCDRQGLIGLVQMFIMAVIANQSTYAISEPTNAVVDAKKAVSGQADLSNGRG